MKYFNLITNPHTLALTIIMLLGIVCLMATSQWTGTVIATKLIGLALFFAYHCLYKRWDRQGKVEPINELFQGLTHGDPEEQHERDDFNS